MSIYLYRLSLVLALGLVLGACQQKDEEPQLSLASSLTEAPITARSEGDTLRIPFSSSISDARLQVAEQADWIETKLQQGMLLVYVARNATAATRQTELLLQIIERGERKAGQRLRIQQSSTEQLAADRYLFPYVTAFDYPVSTFYENRGDVYTLLAPQAGGKLHEPLVLRCSFDARTLKQRYEWQGGAEGWLKTAKIVPHELGWGIELEADPLPKGLAQRKALLHLSDPLHPSLSISYRILQLGARVQLEATRQQLPLLTPGQAELRIPFTSSLPLEELELTTYVVTRTHQALGKSVEETQHQSAQMLQSAFWQYSIKPEDFQMERPELQQYFQLVRTAGGLAIQGRPTSNVNLLGNSLADMDDAIYAFCITNKRNEQRAWFFRQVPFFPTSSYIKSRTGSKAETLHLDQEAGTLELTLQLNGRGNSLSWSTPAGVSIPSDDWQTGLPEGAELSYPDHLTVRGISYPANASRRERRFTITVGYNDQGKSSSEAAKPVSFHCVQAPFTGSYTLTTDESRSLRFAAAPEDYEKYVVATVALTTNLSPELIRIERPTTRSGWLLAQLKTDPTTGLVSSIAFYAEPNETGSSRSTTLRLVPPSGEGLQPLSFTFTQATGQ